MKKQRKSQGFTLLEILIALFIFTILSMMLLAALRSVVKTQNGTERTAQRLHALQMTFLLLGRDIEQIVNRPIFVKANHHEAPVLGDAKQVSFTSSGHVVPEQSLGQSALQRITYTWNDHNLSRRVWPVLDRVSDKVPPAKILLPNVSALRFEYVDNHGQLQRAWPGKSSSGYTTLPKAIAISITIQNWGTIKQLYVIPAQ